MKHFLLFLLAAILVLLAPACSAPIPTATPDLEATIARAIAATQAAQPTAIPTRAPTHTPVPTHTPTETPTSSPTPTATLVAAGISTETLQNGWTRYHDPASGFAVSLPPDWVYLDLTAKDLEMIFSAANEKNPALGEVFSSAYLRSLAATGIKFMAVDTRVGSLSAGIPTSLNILVTELMFDIAMDDYVTITIQQLKNAWGEDISIPHEAVQIGTIAGERITYEVEMNDVWGKSHQVVINQYLFLENRAQYVLTFGTLKPSYEPNQATLIDIAQSFEITR